VIPESWFRRESAILKRKYFGKVSMNRRTFMIMLNSFHVASFDLRAKHGSGSMIDRSVGSTGIVEGIPGVSSIFRKKGRKVC